jgi:hypothetical protein
MSSSAAGPVVGLFIASASLGFAQGKPRALPPLNQAVLEFAEAEVGNTVGNGECIALARAALDHAGATIPESPDSDFVWGRLVAKITAGERPISRILPGDVIQFRDVKTVSRNEGLTLTRSYPHHTAVVSAVSGRSVRIIHQNVVVGKEKRDERNKIVREDPLPIDDMKRGTMWVYRPMAD